MLPVLPVLIALGTFAAAVAFFLRYTRMERELLAGAEVRYGRPEGGWAGERATRRGLRALRWSWFAVGALLLAAVPAAMLVESLRSADLTRKREAARLAAPCAALPPKTVIAALDPKALGVSRESLRANDTGCTVSDFVEYPLVPARGGDALFNGLENVTYTLRQAAGPRSRRSPDPPAFDPAKPEASVSKLGTSTWQSSFALCGGVVDLEVSFTGHFLVPDARRDAAEMLARRLPATVHAALEKRCPLYPPPAE